MSEREKENKLNSFLSTVTGLLLALVIYSKNVAGAVEADHIWRKRRYIAGIHDEESSGSSESSSSSEEKEFSDETVMYAERILP